MLTASRSLPALAAALACLGAPAPARAQFDLSPGLVDTWVRPVIIGWELAGRDLNGVSLGGALLDGKRVVGVSLKQATHSGSPVRVLWLRRGELRAITGKWTFLWGQGTAGLELQGTLDDGSTVALRVEAVTTGSEAHTKDVHLYSVSYRTAAGWKALCGYDASGVEVLATALAGRWDHTQGTATGGAYIHDAKSFTFGCEDSALGKCVLMGYAPWRRVLSKTSCNSNKGGGGWCKPQVTSLRPHHQACTRMLRADYCGDGTPHTVDNVEINVYDGLRVRVDSEAWGLEAEWNEDGAICASHPRIQATKPTCWNELYEPTCGSPAYFDKDTLLISEYQPLP